MGTDYGVVKSEVWQLVRSSQNALINPKTQAEVGHCLHLLKCLLPNGVYTDQLPFSECQFKTAKRVFAEEHYGRLCDFLIMQIDTDWVKWLENAREQFDVFFLNGIHHEALISLCCGIEKSRPSYRQQKCVSLLEQFLSGHHLSDVFWDQSRHPSANSLKDGAERRPVFSSVTQSVLLTSWDDLISCIVSLPDKMANSLKQENSDLFLPHQYIQLVTGDMLSCLHNVYGALESGKDTSVQFLSQLLGRLCVHGYNDQVWGSLLQPFTQYTKTDFIWVRVCNHLVTKVPDRCLEAVIVPVIKKASWYGVVSKLLQDSVMHSVRLKQLLTSKLLFMRYFDNNIVLQNIIGYITSSHSTRSLFIPIFLRLLKLWGDNLALKNTSYEQHVYITKALLVCVSFINDGERKAHRDEILNYLMTGVQNHIGSTSAKVQRLGMIVAENVTQIVETAGEKLKFEYEKDHEVEELLTLLSPPGDPCEDVTEPIASLSLQEDTHLTDVTTGKLETTESGDLDSDDDLEPYDMSHDTKQIKVKAPLYIRDCMEGLISSDQPDRVEVCLVEAEKLIRRKPDNLEEIAVEFAKILLHLQNNFAMVTFHSARHSALTALTVHCPVKVATYLCEQFYDRNYSIRQRLDMLQVLSAAAQELSQPHSDSQPKASLKQNHTTHAEQPTHWRQIVEERIEKKTRRFVKGPTKSPPVAVESRFASVAGYFFFPLLKNFDRRENTLDLLGNDCLVLERLLYTVGMVLHCALNSMISKHMGKTMLDFIWVLRYHVDVSIRRALLFCVCMTVLSVPGFVLMSDLQSDVMETKSWLEDTFEKDEDTECRKLASHALLLIQQVAKQSLSNTLLI